MCGYFSLLLLAAALTAALYLLAELAEEFPSRAGRALRYAILGILSAHTLLLLGGGGIGLLPVAVGLLTHGAYYLTLSTFPFVDLVSAPSALAAVGLVVSHWTWFRFFVNLDHHMAADEGYDVLQVFGFFCVMVWLVPVGLMVSVTINDNVLPGIRPVNYAGTGIGAGGGGAAPNKKHTIFLSLVDVARSAMQGWTGPVAGHRSDSRSSNHNGAYSNGDGYGSGGSGLNAYPPADYSGGGGGLRHHGGGVGQAKKAY